MNNPVVSHEHKGHEHLRGESSNQGSCEPNKSISLDKLVKVDAQQLHRNA